ncbi:hypothetical protein M432DRAFT_648981 [Thermoascus aurantiacus ATCC 26904]
MSTSQDISSSSSSSSTTTTTTTITTTAPRERGRRCTHSALRFTPSPHAAVAVYRRPNRQQRAAAASRPGPGPRPRPGSTRLGKEEEEEEEDDDAKTFPAPLLLPGDELALDPDYPAQNFQDWLEDGDRNEVGGEKRNVVYVVPPPKVDGDVSFVQGWRRPLLQMMSPRAEDVVDYLAAFFHGMPVRVLPSSSPSKNVRFMPWEETTRKTSKTAAAAGKSTRPPRQPQYIGLAIPTSNECVRIRTRPAPDGLFPRQLNLDDLLDAAISMVAVVSSARYNPVLDEVQAVEREHAWPAAHCVGFIEACCRAAVSAREHGQGIRAAREQQQRKRKRKRKSKEDAGEEDSHSDNATDGALTVQTTLPSKPSPLEAALSASRTLPDMDPDSSPSLLSSSLWLSRLCRTASHELAHCFGIDHCVHYACVMQGSASLAEDAHQPPYLCPVDLAKVLHAVGAGTSDGTGTGGRGDGGGAAGQRYRALLAFCEREGNKGTGFWEAFAAWIRGRLKEMGMEDRK